MDKKIIDVIEANRHQLKELEEFLNLEYHDKEVRFGIPEEEDGTPNPFKVRAVVYG